MEVFMLNQVNQVKWIGWMSVVALAACAPAYTYEPSEHATGSIGGHLAADYPIPQAAPQGDVRLASFGLGELAPAQGSSDKASALHLRMVVSNNSPEPWTVDTREQKLDIVGSGPATPAFSTTREGNGDMPEVTVAPGSKRIIDLFFPLPPNRQSESSVPEFDAIWNVHAGSQDVVERTPFARLQVEAYDDPMFMPGYAYGGAWGGPFWYDPMYPYGFSRPWVGGAVIARAPSWHRER
jgi:hypothetical protein